MGACDNKPKVVTQEASITFVDSVYDFGELKHSDEVQTHSFKFYNTGEEPLVISKVYTSCHCSTADYTKTPIASGERGEIVVSFDPSTVAYGRFDKTVHVYSNATRGLVNLKIGGMIAVR